MDVSVKFIQAICTWIVRFTPMTDPHQHQSMHYKSVNFPQLISTSRSYESLNENKLTQVIDDLIR